MNSPRVTQKLHPKQGIAIQSSANEILYGGAAGGGKSHLMRVAAIAWCMDIAGLQVYLFRRQSVDLEKNHLEGPTGLRSLLQPYVEAKMCQIVQGEIRFSNGSKIYLCHCFTGETLVQTISGDIKIKDLVNKTGQIKVTRSFTTYFENVRLVEKNASLVKVIFEDGTFYRCTYDHKFLTRDGFVEARNLTNKLCLTNQSQLSAQRLKYLKEKDSARTLRGIMAGLRPDSIGSFGSIITAQFQKALKFITLTRIRIITELTILSLWNKPCIEGYIPIPRGLENDFSKHEPRGKKPQGNGTLPPRGISGIRSKSLESSLIKLINVARIAGRFLRGLLIQYIERAQEVADSNCDTKKEKLCLKRCKSVQADGAEDVYCMTVPDIGLFPLSNGVLVSNCKDERDKYGYQGAEIHVLLIDELTHFTESIYRFLRSRVRLPNSIILPAKYQGMFPRILTSSNPGNIGHQWVKDFFIDNVIPLQIVQTPKDEGGYKRQYIPARLDDNPSLDVAEYEKNLSGVGSPALVKALRDGDWNAVQGAYFPEFGMEHQIAPFPIPTEWIKFRCFDWGSYHPFACYWISVSDGTYGEENDYQPCPYPKGSLVVYKEWYGGSGPNKGLGLANWEIAAGILDRDGRDRIDYSIADPSIFKEEGGPSIAEQFAKRSIFFKRGDNSRPAGAAEFRGRLVGEGGAPLIYFFNTCVNAIRTIPALQHDETKPELWDTDMDDHSFDAIRYGCMSRPWSNKSRKQDAMRTMHDLTMNEVWEKCRPLRVQDRY